ncbi:unnamed protein product [Sphenostylis stenocarpa]|uniref:Uncharacterized protein n=1 Tax=Sphenostylis stenocarpa TaxID=92480 RepID=A0AA86SJK7_9FABA|nr:unnamed protein product [Sphenostylis stenocarpa]
MACSSSILCGRDVISLSVQPISSYMHTLNAVMMSIARQLSASLRSMRQSGK